MATRYQNKVTRLSDEFVIRARLAAHKEKRPNSRAWAKIAGVSHVTMLKAIRGDTFRDLPHAFTERVENPSRLGGNTFRLSKTIRQEIVSLRQSDPAHWTYAELAQYINSRYGMSYAGSNVKNLIARECGEVIARPAGTKRKALRPSNDNSREVKESRVADKSETKPNPPVGLKVIDISSKEAQKSLAARLLEKRRESAAG